MIVNDSRRIGGSPSSRRLLRAAACAAVVLASAVGAAQAAEPGIPTDIQVTDGSKLFLEAHATGVQIYDCVAVAGGYAWSPATPRADLYGANGKHIGIHYGGPTWEAKDGSKVVAKRDAGVTVDPTAIPWLRLSATPTSAGPDGDRLAGTKWIQRVATVGGLAPAAADCSAATAGTRKEIPYSADYRFWKAPAA
jgi:FtsP/CotA-like multicopper oxidase with cupredoxin domain